MKTTYTKKVTVTLILEPSEAIWLKSLMQNPLNETGDPTIESPQDAKMRRMFWEQLSKYEYEL